VATFQIVCRNPVCDERDVPKEMDDVFVADYQAGLVFCGVCRQPITGTPTEP